MTNLKIGTILIAKEDKVFGNEIQITKGKEYPIFDLKETDRGYLTIIIIDDNGIRWHMSGIDTLNAYFTIKRYTLSDLQEKKIAVKLRNYEEYKRLCEAVGSTQKNDLGYEHSEYHGYVRDGIYALTTKGKQGRILLESIDEIDLGDEGKIEVKETYTCKYCGATLSKDVDEEDCYANPNKNHDSTTATLINSLESEIARLKGDNERLKSDFYISNSQLQILREFPQISQDLTKRERMAWEYLLKSIGSIEGKTWSVKAETAFKVVDTFLAKSKEVKP